MAKSTSVLDQHRLLLHVGLHKCGSTWLQKNLFTDAEIGFVSPWGQMAAIGVAEFVTIDPLNFDASATSDRLNAAAKLPADSQNNTLVLSHEALSSRPHHGLYYAPSVAARLQEVFPGARVLLIFREQAALIHSLYGEHLRNGGRLTLQEFIGTGKEPPGFAGLCQLSFFLFDRLLAMYRDVFGANNVLALPLEMLSKDPHRFVNSICAFAGGAYKELPTKEKVNTAWGPITYKVLRLSNAVVRANRLRPQMGPVFATRRRLLNGLDKMVPRGLQSAVKARQLKAIEDRSAGLYGDSNRRLAEMVGIELEGYGYVYSESTQQTQNCE